MRLQNSRLPALLALTAGALASPAAAVGGFSDLGVRSFTVTSGGAGDFYTLEQCCGSRPNMIATRLGPNGLPVFTPDGGPAIHGVDPSTREIQWWTPGTTNGGDRVVSSGSAPFTMPFADLTFFPPDGSGGDNSNGFLTAHFRGTLTLDKPSFVTAFVGVDDDAFVFLGGRLVAGLGGVQVLPYGPRGSITLNPGIHDLDLFFADRYRAGSALQFAFSVEPVPEPSVWAMLITGFGLLGTAARRRRYHLA